MTFPWIEVWPGWQSSIPCRFEKNARPVGLSADSVADDGVVRSATGEPLDPADPRSHITIVLSLATYREVTVTITKAAGGHRCGHGPFDDTTISEVRFFAPNPCVAVDRQPVPATTTTPAPTTTTPGSPLRLPREC